MEIAVLRCGELTAPCPPRTAIRERDGDGYGNVR